MNKLLAACVVGVALGSGVAAASPEHAIVTKASAPLGTKHSLKLALRKAISVRVDELGLVRKLRGYTIVPALVELQELADTDERESSLACTVALSLQDHERGIVANVRGKATTLGATHAETVDAAAHAAVNRLMDALRALKAQERRASAAVSR
jgi:hypothetical protein